MCFSPTASFGSATILTVLGIGATKLNRSHAQKMFVTMPFLFGIQQASEGFVWLSIDEKNSDLHHKAVFIFLFFAMAIWPSWVSWSVYKAEPERNRKRVLGVLAAIGSIVSVVTTLMLLNVQPSAFITGHSLAYSTNNLHEYIPANFEFLAYITPVLLPFFISSLPLVLANKFLRPT